MDKFTSKLAEGLQNSGLIGPMHKGAGQAAEKIYQPTISDIESVAESLITKTNIAILTGAGISVASGIPTFRGKGGFWTNKNSNTIINLIYFFLIFRRGNRESTGLPHLSILQGKPIRSMGLALRVQANGSANHTQRLPFGNLGTHAILRGK